MAGHYDLGGDAHSHIVAAYGPVEGILGRSFVGGAGAGYINAPLEADSLPCGNGEHPVLQLEVVCAGHIREAGPEIIEVGPDEGIGKEVDMVADEHQVADGEVLVHSSGGIRDEKILDPKLYHHAYGQHDRVHRVAFVVVVAPLHRKDAFPSEGSADEIAFMPYGGGGGEAGHHYVRDGYGILYFVRKLSESASEYDSHDGSATVKPGGKECGCILDNNRSFVHPRGSQSVW